MNQFTQALTKTQHALISALKTHKAPSASDSFNLEDVLCLPANQLEKLVTHWMWDSPNEKLPSKSQIHEIIDAIMQRPDVDELADLLAECNYYVHTIFFVRHCH